MATKYKNYKDLVELSTKYAVRMKYLSNRIFTEVARPTNIGSYKVCRMFAKKPLHMDEDIVNYYPRHVETHWLSFKLREYGLFRDEHEDFNDEMKRLRALRGKAPPKKGEGKRAQIRDGN